MHIVLNELDAEVKWNTNEDVTDISYSMVSLDGRAPSNTRICAATWKFRVGQSPYICLPERILMNNSNDSITWLRFCWYRIFKLCWFYCRKLSYMEIALFRDNMIIFENITRHKRLSLFQDILLIPYINLNYCRISHSWVIMTFGLMS